MLVKVCGMRHADQVHALAGLSDFVGFIYYDQSPRFVTHPPKSEGLKRVGVFVNESIATILEKIEDDELDIVQLHGSESPEEVEMLKRHVTVIKAFPMEDQFDFSQLIDYEGKADYFLLDTKTKHHGGSGKQFTWSILNRYNLTTPFFLSGGIQPDSLKAIQSIAHPRLAGVDINSGFEITPGNKNINLIKQFIHGLKNS